MGHIHFAARAWTLGLADGFAGSVDLFLAMCVLGIIGVVGVCCGEVGGDRHVYHVDELNRLGWRVLREISTVSNVNLQSAVQGHPTTPFPAQSSTA